MPEIHPLPEPAIRRALAHEARRGRLVVFLGTDPRARELAAKIRSLPCSLWFAVGQDTPADGPILTPAEIEEGRLRRAPAGAVVAIDSLTAFGTPRCPSRLRAWLQEILRRRAVWFIGAEQDLATVGLAGDRRRLSVQDLEPFLDELLEQTRAVTPKPPPPLPADSSGWGLTALVATAAFAVLSWLLLYLWYGEAQNWRWLHLVPGALLAVGALAALLPWLSQAAAGRELSAAECYARALARWSRWPRAPVAAATVFIAGLAPWWLGGHYVLATFLVIYEAAGVTADGRDVGACKAEEPCTLVVPRQAHLHFEGVEGACAMDLLGAGGLIMVDLQEEACEAPPEGTPRPRGG